MSRRESGHPPAQRQLRRYILGSFYVLILMLPPVAALAVLAGGGTAAQTPGDTAGRITFVVAFTLHCLVSARAMHLTVSHEVDGTPLPRLILPLLAVTTLAALLSGGLALGGTTAAATWPLWPMVATLIVAACAVTPLMTTPRSTVLALAVTGLALAATWVQNPWPGLDLPARAISTLITVGVPTLLMALSMVLTTRWSVFILRSVDEQSRMYAMRADLAVAEERLRIARDMHDVMGRTLTAVALKSDLAAALADAGSGARAARESRAIHDLATESLSELRGVLAGYRRPDLATELAGARSLLQSAGVSTRIVGDVGGIPPWAAEPLSWVLRESATNIVRHADATRATLGLEFASDATTLTVTNDGVRGRADVSPPGSGLLGLSARLVDLGGVLETGTSGGTFTVTARLPRPADEGVALVPPMEVAHTPGPAGARPGEETR